MVSHDGCKININNVPGASIITGKIVYPSAIPIEIIMIIIKIGIEIKNAINIVFLLFLIFLINPLRRVAQSKLWATQPINNIDCITQYCNSELVKFTF